VALVRRVTEDGLADVLYVRSPHEIVKQLADKPTLLLDATLPDLDLVRPFYPNVELLAEIEAEMPHARATSRMRRPLPGSFQDRKPRRVMPAISAVTS
jgi:hypothetical protein